ncbi:hypothetical protein FGB62_138g05 [Gracilaria domingensis]|nr:hypothetical protein FGB62_138g05 [Gracilaria domingensis]
MSDSPDSPSPSPDASASAPRFLLQQATEYDIDIRTLSTSGEFTIKRITDSTPFFKLKRENFSMRNVRRLYDMDDVALYKMEKKSLIDFRYRTQIVDEVSGHTVLVLRRKGYLPGRGANTIVAWNGESEEGEPYLIVETGVLRRHFTIKEHATGKVVAEARREKIGRKFLLNVQPGYDAAFFVFFAIAVDVNYQDSNAAASSAGAGAY